MNKELKYLREIEIMFSTSIKTLEDIFAADDEPIKEQIKKEKHALKQIPKIETALKNYEELTNKPLIYMTRTRGQANNIIKELSKYPNIKVGNLEDCNKMEAFEIIKEKEVNVEIFKSLLRTGYTYEQFEMVCLDEDGWNDYPPYKHHMTIEEFELLREVLL